PEAEYHAKTSGQTQVIGAIIGAGGHLQGLIAATTKKGDGLGKPLNDAINYLIKKGTYGKILARWGLTSDGVSTSRLNPPGLPIEGK
ncbi:ABC transporter substrate-binding protein, partial [Streptomyces asiaticus]